MSFRINILFVVLGMGLLAGCKRASEESEEATSAIKVPVTVTRLSYGTIESTVLAVGTTDALHKEKIVSPVSGRIISFSALEGSVVHAGDIVAVIRTRESQSAIDGARRLTQYATTEQQKREAERALALADSLQSQVTVRATFDGIIATRSATEGELVGEQAELMTLIDVSSLVFIADVPVGSISSVHLGLHAIVQFPQLPEEKLQGVVDGILPQVDAESQSVKVRLTFLNITYHQRNFLKTKMQGSARITIQTHSHVLLTSRAALLHNDETNSYSLVVMTPDSLAQTIPVEVGAQTDSLVEVRSPRLTAGLMIIQKGNYAIADSTRVTVEAP